MRGQNTFEIAGYDKKFIVNELTVRQIIDIFKMEDFEEKGISGIKDVVMEKILPIATNLKEQDLYEMCPSELEIIWDKFHEINASFFRIASKAGVDKMLAQVKENMVTGYLDSLAVLSNEDTPTS